MGFLSDWNEFWFKPVTTRSIALYRIALGLLTLVWCALMLPDIGQWYSEQGVYPLAAMPLRTETDRGLDVLRHVHQLWITYAAFAVMVVSAITFTVGFWTRASSIILSLLMISFNHRNSIILNSGDTMLRICIFLMIFSAADQYLSVDRWMKVRDGEADADEVPLAEPWAQRLIQLQVTFVYLFTVVWKASGQMWMNGTAVYFPLHMGEIARFPLPYLANNLLFINLVTYGTMLMEVSLCTLIWVPRLRKYILAAGVLLHTGIDYAINIPLFSQIMVAGYLTFFKDEWSARVIEIGSRFLRRRATSDAPAANLSPSMETLIDEIAPVDERETSDAK